jgi:cytochrome c-type biogenesis protein CcmH/NrfG
LRGARGAKSLSSILVGAGCGLAILPWVLRRDPAASTGTAEIFAAQLLPFGVLAAVLGSGLALLSVPGRSARARWLACAAVLPLCLPVLLVPSKPLFLLSPWEKMPTLPFLAFETPAGLATVETGKGGLKLATLDRIALSPGLDGVRVEQQQIRSSFASLPPEVRAGRNVRVLLVGQLTQLRAAQLVEQDAVLIDRTAAWHEAMPRLEGELLKDYSLPPGEIISPREAEERLRAGDYDLAIVLTARGDPPAWRTLDPRPEKTLVARWSAVREPLLRCLPDSTFAGSAPGERVFALAGSGLQDVALGVFDGAARPAPDAAGRTEFVRLEGTPSRPSPLARLLLRRTWRTDVATRAATEALAQDNGSVLTRGLADFWRDQIPSSPYETESQQIELEPGVLALLREAALAAPPSVFVRGAWEWLARVLVGKRDVAAIEAYVAPVAARWAPWPELEVALARADLEALDPDAARRRLEPFAGAQPQSFELLTVLGQAHEQAGDGRAAVQAYKAALALRPTDRGARSRLAMAQVRAGDPEGVEAVRTLLQEDPGDEGLRPFLGPGPWPRPQDGDTPDPRPH